MIKYLSLVVLLLFALPLLAEDEGKDLAFRYKCMTCHGISGVSASADYPHLAGQKQLYLVSRLQYFASDQEPYSRMRPHAIVLTEEEMTKLAEYFSSQSR